MKHLISKTLVAAILVASVSAASMAGDDTKKGDYNLKAWSKGASAELQTQMNKKMYGPAADATGQLTYLVTVNADGSIKDYQRQTRRGDRVLGGATARLIRNLDLPALPKAYRELTLRVVMNYEDATASFGRRAGSVTTKRISKGEPKFAGLKVVNSVAAK